VKEYVSRWMLDHDLVRYLGRQRMQGESESDLLRRLLGVPSQNDRGRNLVDKLTSPGALHPWNATDRFLAILAAIHAEDPEAFGWVLLIRWRKRTYFALDREGIEQSGRRTYPRRIPNSPYWVLTNLRTNQKCMVLESVLRRGGYSPRVIASAVKAFESGLPRRTRREKAPSAR